MNNYEAKQYQQELEECIRSMMATFKKMNRQKAEKECIEYMRITRIIYKRGY